MIRVESWWAQTFLSWAECCFLCALEWRMREVGSSEEQQLLVFLLEFAPPGVLQASGRIRDREEMWLWIKFIV